MSSRSQTADAVHPEPAQPDAARPTAPTPRIPAAPASAAADPLEHMDIGAMLAAMLATQPDDAPSSALPCGAGLGDAVRSLTGPGVDLVCGMASLTQTIVRASMRKVYGLRYEGVVRNATKDLFDTFDATGRAACRQLQRSVENYNNEGSPGGWITAAKTITTKADKNQLQRTANKIYEACVRHAGSRAVSLQEGGAALQAETFDVWQERVITTLVLAVVVIGAVVFLFHRLPASLTGRRRGR